MKKTKKNTYTSVKTLEDLIRSNDQLTGEDDLKNIDPKQYWTNYYNELFEEELKCDEERGTTLKKIEDDRGKPLLFKTPKDMVKKAIKYFVACKVSYEPVTVTGLCLSLGFATRISINRYAQFSENWANAINKMKLIVEQFAESMLYSKFNSGAKFSLINQGWEQRETRIVQEQSFDIDMKKPEDEY